MHLINRDIMNHFFKNNTELSNRTGSYHDNWDTWRQDVDLSGGEISCWELPREFPNQTITFGHCRKQMNSKNNLAMGGIITNGFSKFVLDIHSYLVYLHQVPILLIVGILAVFSLFLISCLSNPVDPILNWPIVCWWRCLVHYAIRSFSTRSSCRHCVLLGSQLNSCHCDESHSHFHWLHPCAIVLAI